MGSSNSRPFRFFAAVGGVLLLSLSVSCANKNLLVVADPHVSVISNGLWEPLKLSFRIRARASGYITETLILEKDDNLDAYFAEDRIVPDLMIVSPYIMTTQRLSDDNAIRTIAAGMSTVPAGAENIEILLLDRKEAMAEAGRLCAEIAVELNMKPYGVFRTSDEERALEMEAFLGAYVEEAGDFIPIEWDEIGRGTESLPPDFDAQSESADFLVLFAGSQNLTAISATSEKSIPVITEYALSAEIYSDRILASIEDSPQNLASNLLKMLKEPHSEPISRYSAVLISGKADKRK